MEEQKFYTVVVTDQNPFYGLGNLFDMSKETPLFIKRVMVLDKELLN